MKTYRLYIGSNNKTKELEDKRAEAIISQKFNGFTTIKRGVSGHWKGASEKTMIVEIATDKNELLNEVIEELKAELKQDAIGVNIIGEMQFI